MAKAWKLRESRIAFQSKWMTLRQDTVELPNGKIIDDYFVAVRPDVAAVFALTPDNHVIMVRQYKHGVGQIVLEVPAGTFPPGEEDPQIAAERELLEETGYTSDPLVQIAVNHDDPTRNTNRIYLYFGANARKVAEQELDENEAGGGLDVVLIPLAEMRDYIRRGDIFITHSLAQIYRALDWLENEAPDRAL